MGQTEERNEDDHPIGDGQDDPSGLLWLRLWMEAEYWNFDTGRNQFDGYSEGLCVLAGINPQESHLTSDQYGPDFLPGAGSLYGCGMISQEDQRRIKEAVDAVIDDLKSLGLEGRVHCHQAIAAAVEKGLAPPWLDAANNDFECAKKLPAKLRTNNEIIRRINRGASSKGGKNRAEKNVITQILNTLAFQEFEKLSEKGFPGCLADSSGRPKATEIADKIYHALGARFDHPDEPLPELPTIAKRVGGWLKEKNVSSES